VWLVFVPSVRAAVREFLPSPVPTETTTNPQRSMKSIEENKQRKQPPKQQEKTRKTTYKREKPRKQYLQTHKNQVINLHIFYRAEI